MFGRKRKEDQPRPDENFEPYEEFSGIPMPVYWIAIALAIWGAFMLYDTGKDVTLAQDERVEDRAVQVSADLGEGGNLFVANCSTCHQPDGQGLRGAVPPLAQSEVLAAGPEIVARILLRGIDGPIRVRGEDFDGHMPSFASALNDDEIARIASYVTLTFGEAETKFDPSRVAELRDELADAGSFAGGAELAKLATSMSPQSPYPAPNAANPMTATVQDLVFEGRGDVWACASCHGDLGQGHENTPRLAGQPADYLAKQLNDFRDGTRNDESMQIVAAGLSDAETAGLSAYFATLRAPSNASPNLSANLARGEQLALRGDWSLGVPACFTCHGSSGFGVAPDFPALAAQHAPYTATQLAAWAGGNRQNSPLGVMRQISQALSSQDRRAVADYLASLPPVPAGQTASAEEETSNVN